MAATEEGAQTVEEAVMAVRDAVTLVKKENSSDAKKNAKAKAVYTVKLAVSQYIKELLKEGDKQSDIADKIYGISLNATAQNPPDDSKNPNFEKTLGNWLHMKSELSLDNLCFLTQVRHVTYDYILVLDRMAGTSRLAYGYVLDFFFYLFRSKKIEVLKQTDFNLPVPVDVVASKNGFNMTRYFVFKDEILLGMFGELNQQKLSDIDEQNERRSGYTKILQRLLIEYENIPLDSESGKVHQLEDKQSLPANTQDGHYKRRDHGLPDNLGERLQSLYVEYGKNQAGVSKDTGISKSLLSEWGSGTKKPSPSNLLLMAVTYGFPVNPILSVNKPAYGCPINPFLSANEPDKTGEIYQYKYTYGNTLRFIQQLLDADIIKRISNLEYWQLTGKTLPTDINGSGSNSQIAYLAGIFLICDDFLLRLITEMEAKVNRPDNFPQNEDISQASYEMSQSDAKKFIARYNEEPLLNYRGEIGRELGVYSAKWLKGFDWSSNKRMISPLDMSVDLDRMLKELRDVETKALKDKAAIKQDT